MLYNLDANTHLAVGKILTIPDPVVHKTVVEHDVSQKLSLLMF